MKLSFIYLSFPFWRAEISKITLYVAGIDFENRIILPEEFQKVKKDLHQESINYRVIFQTVVFLERELSIILIGLIGLLQKMIPN